MISLFFVLLAISILRSYPEARKLRLRDSNRIVLLRLIVLVGSGCLLVTIYFSFNSSIEDIQNGKMIVGFAGLFLLVLCAPIVLYMQVISIFTKFTFFDSQMKKLMLID